MSRKLRTRKRQQAILALESKLARRGQSDAQGNLARTWQIKRQLSSLSEQMLDPTGCQSARDLAARFEFGHRLLALEYQQSAKLQQAEQQVSEARLKSRLADHRSDRSDRELRRALIRHEQLAMQKSSASLQRPNSSSPGNRFGVKS